MSLLPFSNAPGSSSGTGTVTSVAVSGANGIGVTGSPITTTGTIDLTLGAITPSTVNSVTISGTSTPTLAVTGTTTVSGSNTGDQTNITGNAATVTTNADLTGDVTSVGNAATVVKINGTSLAGLATGILKNTTSTGIPSIAVASDFPTLNQNTTGSAATLTTARTIAGVSFNGSANIAIPASGLSNGVTGSGAVVLATSPTLVTPALGTPASGVMTNVTGTASGLTAGNVTTNANLTGVITSVGNATSIASQTGTGSTFVVATSPTLVTPTLGVATATSVTSNINYFNNNAVTVASNAATVPVTYRFTTVTNNAAGAVTITITTTSAVDGQLLLVRFLDYSAATQTLAWTNTQNTLASAPLISKGSTTKYSYVGFAYNSAASLWDCVASA